VGAAALLTAAAALLCIARRRSQSLAEKTGSLDDPLLPGSSVEIPAEIAKQGREAISAYNAALRGGKQHLNWTKLMFVGQERVGKSSLLRNLTSQSHNPKEVTTDGVDTCVIETSAWER
jgi:polynucleotide 5'-kinase involved in rRNA processing